MSTPNMPESKTLKLGDVLEMGQHFLGLLRAKWKLICLITFIGGFCSIAYYFLQKPAYEGVSTFILEEKSVGGGSLAGIASQFGLDIGGMAGGSGIFAGDNILDIIKSRQIIEKVLLTKLDSTKSGSEQSLADVFLQLIQWKKKWVDEPTVLATVNFNNIGFLSKHSTTQDSVLGLMYERIIKKNLSVERLNKKGSIISISTVSTDPVFSKLFTERLLLETKRLYIEIKTGNLQANLNRLERRSDSLLAVLNAKSFQTASLQSLDANPAYRNATVPVELSQRDKSVASAIYAEVVKNLEISRIALSQQTPVIQILDTPKYPLNDQKKKISILLLMGLAGGLALSIVWVALSFK